jgi:hypothetical protein
MNTLNSCIHHIAQCLGEYKRANLNELETRTAIIDPILSALDWEVGNPSIVRHGYPLADRTFVDYALFVSNRVRLVIEAKALNVSLSNRDASQLLAYCGKLGVEYGILSNGIEWKVYRVIGKQNIEDRLLSVIRLDSAQESDDALQAIVEKLDILRRNRYGIPTQSTEHEPKIGAIARNTLTTTSIVHRKDNSEPPTIAKTDSLPPFLSRSDATQIELWRIIDTFVKSLGSDVVPDEDAEKQMCYRRGTGRNTRFCRLKLASGSITVMLSNVIKGEWLDLPTNIEYDKHGEKLRPRMKITSEADLDKFKAFIERAYGRV